MFPSARYLPYVSLLPHVPAHVSAHVSAPLQVPSRLQAGVPLVPLHQGVQLRRAGAALDAAAPDTPEQHVHAVAHGYHHGGCLRPRRGGRRPRWWLREEALPVHEEEELRHVSPHGDHGMQRRRWENTKWRSSSKRSTRGVLLRSLCIDVTLYTHTNTHTHTHVY